MVAGDMIYFVNEKKDSAGVKNEWEAQVCFALSSSGLVYLLQTSEQWKSNQAGKQFKPAVIQVNYDNTESWLATKFFRRIFISWKPLKSTDKTCWMWWFQILDMILV